MGRDGVLLPVNNAGLGLRDLLPPRQLLLKPLLDLFQLLCTSGGSPSLSIGRFLFFPCSNQFGLSFGVPLLCHPLILAPIGQYASISSFPAS